MSSGQGERVEAGRRRLEAEAELRRVLVAELLAVAADEADAVGVGMQVEDRARSVGDASGPAYAGDQRLGDRRGAARRVLDDLAPGDHGARVDVGALEDLVERAR